MKYLFILYESIFLISFSSLIEPKVQLGDFRAADSALERSQNAATTPKNQFWDISLSTGQLVKNVQPIEIIDYSLIVIKGEKTYSFPLWDIIRLKVPKDRLSAIKHGIKKGFIFPFALVRNVPFEFDPDSFEELLVGLILLPIVAVFVVIALSFFGIIGAIIGGTLGVFHRSSIEINLFELPMAEKIDLVRKLLGNR